MSLDLDTNLARQADRFNSSIKESGKYVGVITRAEKLISKKNTEGLGISFKSENDETANYLDLYTVNAEGKKLPSMNIVQAILCCTRTKSANEGAIEFEAWDKDSKKVVKKSTNGYPDLMGKKIGLLLQKELSTNEQTGEDVERMVIYGVFEPSSELTASEILDKKTVSEVLPKMLTSLMNKPVNDRREKKSSHQQNNTATNNVGFEDIPDDIPF
jgi:hypothetical protein